MTAVINNGICRCCATEGSFKDLKSKYHWMGDEEIYADMLKDCFDIGLLLTEESESSGICEVCITQLRNAANFKRQVLHTEEQFKSHINSKAFKEGQPSFVKIEVPLQDEGNSDTDLDNDIFSEDCNTEFEVPIKREKVETKAKKRATRSSAASAKKVKLEGETSKQYELHCEICESTFTNTYNLKRHTLNVHGLYQDSTKKRLCDGCGKIFFNDKWLKRHLAIGCPGKDVKTCTECDVTFEKQEDMLKHVRRIHWARNETLKFKCHLCETLLTSHEVHDSHLLNEHRFKLEYEDYTFDCAEDFKQWKQAMENKQDVIFVKRNLKDGYYYHCFPKSQLGRTSVRPKDNFCPARINVVEELGLILVTCQSKHSCKDVKRVDRKQLACSACDEMFIKYEEMHEHLVNKHQVEIVVEDLKFCSFKGTETDDCKRKRKKKRKISELSATPERSEHRVNLTSILQYSTASPFRDKTMRGFSCLYCCKAFATIHELRAHTSLQIEKDKLNSMIDYKLSYNPIKVDITDLRCTLCTELMKDLNHLKDHLSSIHNKNIYRNIKDIILPFRLEDGNNFTCVVCSVSYASFKNLYHHMSSHYRNYCCKKCGAGYITIAALRKHGKTHEQGNFPCAYCDKIYSSLSKKKNHEKGVHTGGWLRNKCPHCPQIFVSYYDRSEHLVKEHNETPLLFPCNACNKVYKKKFELNRHIKHHHLQQKNYTCDMCNAKFFSKRGLVDHMTRHGAGEVHPCQVCGRSFTRARTLKEHMRNHDDDKRFQCEVCKKSFVQKCSLKTHMRLHQDDLEIFKEFDDVKHLVDNRPLTLKQIAAENRKKEAEERKQQFV